MEFNGTVEAVTKIDNADGMALRVTISGGVYIEITGIDRDRFEKLCVMVDLKRKLSVSISDDLQKTIGELIEMLPKVSDPKLRQMGKGH